jgi:hypothetical protein
VQDQRSIFAALFTGRHQGGHKPADLPILRLSAERGGEPMDPLRLDIEPGSLAGASGIH